jgi:hypothetical protein
MGMLMEAPLDGSIMRATYRGHTLRYHPATSFTSMATEIKLQLGNDPYVSRYMA